MLRIDVYMVTSVGFCCWLLYCDFVLQNHVMCVEAVVFEPSELTCDCISNKYV
jgi:hypothetical protein